MKVLIIGSGGREHALAAALAQDGLEIYVAPGNAGIAREFACLRLQTIEDLVKWCEENHPAYVLFGPEQPLAAGWVDILEEAGIRCVGPTQAAARIESSKAFAKDLMSKCRIPTAAHRFFTNQEHARSYLLSQQNYPLVIKADGLAAGKGVTIAHDLDEALLAIASISGQIVIEEYLEGWEVSLFAVSDGEYFKTTIFAQDHKQLGEGDTGPNTGGMGAYCPVLEAECHRRKIEDEIIAPTLKALRDEGCPYRGFLYCGLMITSEGPTVLEFNCRLGDPEAQALLPLLETPLAGVCAAIIDHTVKDLNLAWKQQSAVCVVLASRGYPGTCDTGFPIAFTKPLESLIRFGGVADAETGLVTSGGRVLALVGLGDNVSEARERAYRDVSAVAFEGKQFRGDIALRTNVL